MGPDLELKDRLGSMESLDSKENKKSLGEPGEKNICCISYQDDILELETSELKQAEQVKQLKNSKVRITESADHTSLCLGFEGSRSENPLNESASQGETENSSSFGKTLSGDENDDILSGSEVVSKLRDNEFDQECQMRKKKLTPHWQTFIQPYMWRCRWAELKMRQLRYQASKYDLKAEAISRRQQLTSKDLTVEDTGAKSLPFSGSMQKRTLIQRRKRKRVEDSTDTAAYMAHHPLFSYPGHKKCGAVVVSSLNERKNIGIPTNNRVEGNSVFGYSDEQVSLEFRNDDNSLEQILWKIGVLQSHLGELKTRFKKVHDENAKAIYSADAMNSNGVSTTSTRNNVSTYEREKLVQVSTVASQLMPKCNRGDMLTTGTAISTHGEDTNLIDIIECNDQLQNGISCEKEGDANYNSTASELNNNTETVEIQPTEKVEIQPTENVEIQRTEKVEIQPTDTEKSETPKEEEQANIVQSVPVPVSSISDDQRETPKEQANMSSPVQEISVADDEPSPKKRSISGLTSTQNTRNRGRVHVGRGRRRGSRWSRRA